MFFFVPRVVPILIEVALIRINGDVISRYQLNTARLK